MKKIIWAILISAALIFGFASCDDGDTGEGGGANMKKLVGLWQCIEAPVNHYEIRNDYFKWIGIKNYKEELIQSGKIIYFDETTFIVDLDFNAVDRLYQLKFTYSFDGNMIKIAAGVAPTYTFNKIKN
jgi:hypothetical protein